MGLNLYEIKSSDLIKVVQALPVGRLLSTGNGLIPNIRQSLYSEIVSEIAAEPLAIPRGKADGPLPTQSGLPENRDVINVGHLVIAQESLDHGWAEAIVINRANDLTAFTVGACIIVIASSRFYSCRSYPFVPISRAPNVSIHLT